MSFITLSTKKIPKKRLQLYYIIIVVSLSGTVFFLYQNYKITSAIGLNPIFGL